MRNSSLVKFLCADNVTGLKFATEVTGSPRSAFGRDAVDGRGAFWQLMKASREGRWRRQK